MNSTDTTLPDQIIQLLRESYPHLVKLNDIAKRLQIVSDTPEYDGLRAALAALMQSGEIYKSSRRRFGWKPGGTGEFAGTLRMVHNRGLVETGDAEFPTVYIKQNNLSTAFDGDSVRVKMLALRNQPLTERYDLQKEKPCRTGIGEWVRIRGINHRIAMRFVAVPAGRITFMVGVML